MCHKTTIFRQMLTLVIGLWVHLSNGQHKNPDSLIHKLKTENLSQEERSKHLSLLAHYHPRNDTALLVAKQAVQIAVEIGNPILEAEALEEISHLQNKLGNNDLSFQATFKALRIYESLGMHIRQAASYTQLANNYMSNENFAQAITFLKKAKTIYAFSDQEENLVFTMLNLGEMFRLSGQLDSAEVSFKKVLSKNLLLKNPVAQGYSLGNLGMVYAKQDKLIEAKHNLNAAITLMEPLGDPYSTSVYLAELGQVLIKEGNHADAEQKMLKAMKMAKEAGLKEQVRDFGAQLSQYYESQGSLGKALAYQKLFQVYQDSLINKANIQKIERIKAGYEIDKRESEIELLNTINASQKNLVLLLSVGVIITLCFAYLLQRGKRRIRKTNEKLSQQKETIAKREQEKALLLKELNHRTKNNLQIISSLLNLQSFELKGHPAHEAIIAGKNRVEALSLVHRKLYQEGLETRIMIKEYIEDLVLGLFHGYDAKFEPQFHIEDTSIDVDTAVPLALTLNEIVVNSLKYAYVGIVNPKLVVSAQKKQDWIHLDIMDNGIGFDDLEKKNQNSFGLKLITTLTKQMDGSLERIESHGTHWRLGLRTT